MAVRVYDNGSLYSISAGEREISDFCRTWPASNLGGLRSLWVQFDRRNGDLVDIKVNGRAGASRDRFEGDALHALIEDMQCYAAAKLGFECGREAQVGVSWKKYLGEPTTRKGRR